MKAVYYFKLLIIIGLLRVSLFITKKSMSFFELLVQINQYEATLVKAEALPELERKDELLKLFSSLLKALKELYTIMKVPSTNLDENDVKGYEYLFKTLNRLLQRLSVTSFELLSKDQKKLLIQILETFILLFENVGSPKTSVQFSLSKNDLSALAYTFGIVLEDFKLKFIEQKKPFDADSEHVLELLIPVLSLFFVFLQRNTSQPLFLELQRGLSESVLSQFILTSLLFASSRYSSTTTTGSSNVIPKSSLLSNTFYLSCIDLVNDSIRIFSTSSSSQESNNIFWRKSFPGIFSILFNLIRKMPSSEM
jgi:hypothetical protein